MLEKLKALVELEVTVNDYWESKEEASDAIAECENYIGYVMRMSNFMTLTGRDDIKVMDITVTPDISEHIAEWEAADALEKKRMDNELKLTKGEVG